MKSRTFIRAKQFLKSFCELLKQNSFFRWTSLMSILLFAFTLVLPIWRIVPIAFSKPFIPLHYNVYFGVDRFGPWYAIFVLPVLGFLFLIINVSIQVHFASREKLLTRFFSVSTVVLELIFLIAMLLIILLNI
ncbi:hypothetical protein HYV69_03055 [Candidatus Uhrbacteria bacterium]|nr:hypothetical protein [Candidatus Uhrbacteria bacterium]